MIEEKMLLKKGGYAFPVSNKDGSGNPGMNLRQWYAGLAMQGLCVHTDDNEIVVSEAFKIADKMLLEDGYQL